jgi:hypothetical protein
VFFLRLDNSVRGDQTVLGSINLRRQLSTGGRYSQNVDKVQGQQRAAGLDVWARLVMVDRIAEFVGTFVDVVKLIATGTVVGVLFCVIDIAELRAAAMLSDLSDAVATCSETIS